MKLLLTLSFWFMLLVSNAAAWDTDTVHPFITSNALTKANNLDRFLADFGLTNESFDGQYLTDGASKSAREWIVLGSIWEDYGPDHKSAGLISPNNRFLNHFFDPVNNIGLTVPISILNVNGQISRDWAKGIRIDTVPDTPTNIFSWRDARTYLYDALTDVTNTERKRNFALTFRSLGQVIHLLEDMSQPSHVRNDPHVSFTDVPILSRWFNPSRLEDWGKLNGGDVYVAGATAKALPTFDSYFNGLAAITNTNFFSDDTILKNYAMPSADQTDIGNFTFYDLLSTVVDEDGEVSRTVYITKTGGLRSGYKVAHAGYFSVDLFSRLGVFNSHQFEIDDRVAQENAQVLIPMAVEYSSGLLNYFFRGKMNMEADPQNAGKYIIKNESSEKMEGPFSLYYDDDTGNRRYITTWTLSINPNSPSTPISFTEPTSPAPKEKGKYILVFNGKLGMEEGAVVGREVTLSCGGSSGTITGPDEAFTGKSTQYTLNWPDAVGNVTWSTDSPVTSIWGDNNGATLWIQSYGSCSYNQGAIKITATDACGTQTEYMVQAGTWVLVSSTGVKCSYACETISGSFKTEYWWKGCCDGNSNNCAGCKAECGGNPIGGLPPCGSVQSGTCPLPCGTNCCWCYNTFGVFNYEWRCQ